MKKKPFIIIKISPKKVKQLLKYHTVEDLKQVAYQLVSYGLDGMASYDHKKGLRFVELLDTDIFY